MELRNSGLGEPIHLVMAYVWPPSQEHVEEQFDIAAGTAFQVLNGSWQRVLAEVRLCAECEARGNDALRFIHDKVLQLDPRWIEGLGKPLTFEAVKLEIAPSGFERDPIEGP